MSFYKLGCGFFSVDFRLACLAGYSMECSSQLQDLSAQLQDLSAQLQDLSAQLQDLSAQLPDLSAQLPDLWEGHCITSRRVSS